MTDRLKKRAGRLARRRAETGVTYRYLAESRSGLDTYVRAGGDLDQLRAFAAKTPSSAIREVSAVIVVVPKGALDETGEVAV